MPARRINRILTGLVDVAITDNRIAETEGQQYVDWGLTTKAAPSLSICAILFRSSAG